MKDRVERFPHHQGRQHDIARVKGDLYAAADVHERKGLPTFECGFEEAQRGNLHQPQALANRANGGCVEVAIDVDNFTYNTYKTTWGMPRLGIGPNGRCLRDLHPRVERVVFAAGHLRAHLANARPHVQLRG